MRDRHGREAVYPWSFHVGTVLGIPVRVHMTFLLLVVFFAFLGALGGGERTGDARGAGPRLRVRRLPRTRSRHDGPSFRGTDPAQAALEALEARGGTEMAHAIQEALTPLRHDAQRQVVLVSDGQIGFKSEVLGSLMNQLPANSRAHAVGIGAAPNRALPAGVARAGRGVELLVNDPVSAREAARRLCAATARPVITGVTIEGAAVLRPATDCLRDVFAGQPLIAAVELRREGGTVEVRGRMAGSAEPWVRRIEVPAGEAPATEVGV